MLSAAQEVLEGLGVLARDAPLPPFWARMSGNLVLMVYAGDGSMHSVKIGVRSRLDREYRGLTLAHAAMPRNVPRPLTLAVADGQQVLVCAGVAHERLVPRDVATPRFWRGMESFIDATVAAFETSDQDDAVDPCAALLESGAFIGWNGREAYRDDLRTWLATMPRIRQHGDFAINNIGVAGDDLVFFDWEDFGRADVPGFDLAVVLLSVHDFDAGALRRRLRSDSPEAGLAHRLCDRLAIPRERFEQLMPAFLAVFVALKRLGGYDDASANRARAALRTWVGSPSS